MNKDKATEFIRFIVVGVLATAIHYGIYLLFLMFIQSWIAYSLGYAISFICNFFLSNYFTFKTRPTIKKGFGFGFSHAINYLLHIVLLFIFLQLGVPEQFAPVPVFAIVVPVNFILVRFFLKDKVKC